MSEANASEENSFEDTAFEDRATGAADAADVVDGAASGDANSSAKSQQEQESADSASAVSAGEPKPANEFEVLLITGMSGAGRSHAADCVEDMGWYVVDNMPPKLLVPLVDMMTASASKVHKLAAVIDVRSRSYFDDLSVVLGHLDDLGVKTRILFLDASDEVLIKRYESVRRPHPLQHGNRLIDGIHEERELLSNLKERADTVIDTSSLSIHQLSTKLYEALLGSGASTVSVHIFSFGFKYGIPLDADFVADVRFLPNPYWVPSLRELTGQDRPVSDYVLSSDGAGEFLDAYEKAVMTAIEGYAKEDKHYVTIAVGCTGGQHRSVAMSAALAQRLRAHGLSVTVSARELHRRQRKLGEA
ncbi:MAG: RNase adapter RapZ [Bifidobacterium tibiigranuli]|nr:RNase adapter RapZ [Bifidobacterium tibiigranuli]MCH3974552.1 RNase adapter RapZ [Bifidobacterium tibiigranuli]MCH4189470.1 RNase adapter RapZ [Bifidobacterium tibiigranuli]MCH4204293.1 RNase adapter RapZ [Bifidobacterium tibiigranuli]MCH4275340.1 RNase adapter RapZ [Bifidobacterium tibiigranuli]MCI1797366.1 RNase adapter RapZ [Bifidobacterium tibiigranuli]